MNDRKKILTLVADMLVPAIEAHGFSRHQTQKERHFPFGDFRRQYPSGIEVIEVQFDKNGRSKFIINFGVIPNEGFQDPQGRFFSANETKISWMPEWYRLHPSRYFWSWFSPSAIPGMSDPAKPVERAVQLIPELEDWFRAGKIGPHIRRAGFPLVTKEKI